MLLTLTTTCNLQASTPAAMSQINAPNYRMDERQILVERNDFRATRAQDPLAQAQALLRRTKPPARYPGAMAVTVAIPLTAELERGACFLE